MLAPSRILRTTPGQAGGWREREALVEKSRTIIAEGSRSFAFASRLFDRDTRERAWLLYAWCRSCDDIADGQVMGGKLHSEEPGSKAAKDRVEAIRVLTHRSLSGQPTADVPFDAFGQVAAEVGIGADVADDVIDGFALDAEGWRPRTEADLMRYCYHVAGAVGVMMAKVMGVRNEDSEVLDRACDLGLAFQLANIARDIDEDDAGGRCYLPMEWLAEMDIAPGQHDKPHNREKLAQLAARLVDLMESHEAAAKLGAARLAFRQRWAVLAAARIYSAIGRKVRERGAQAWNQRVYTSAWAKLGHVAAALFEAMINRPGAPKPMPRWTRSELVEMAREGRPRKPEPMTPLDDEGIV